MWPELIGKCFGISWKICNLDDCMSNYVYPWLAEDLLSVVSITGWMSKTAYVLIWSFSVFRCLAFCPYVRLSVCLYVCLSIPCFCTCQPECTSVCWSIHTHSHTHTFSFQGCLCTLSTVRFSSATHPSTLTIDVNLLSFKHQILPLFYDWGPKRWMSKVYFVMAHIKILTRAHLRHDVVKVTQLAAGGGGCWGFGGMVEQLWRVHIILCRHTTTIRAVIAHIVLFTCQNMAVSGR